VVVALVLAVEELYRRYKFRKRLRDILREHLSDSRWTWRTFEALQRAIREDAETTKQLLLEIKARPSKDEKDVWTLDK
jgi:hypothetical protein